MYEYLNGNDTLTRMPRGNDDNYYTYKKKKHMVVYLKHYIRGTDFIKI